jgi:hypothetical protein
MDSVPLSGYGQITGPSAELPFACPCPFQGPGPAAGVALTTSQLPGNVVGPGTKIWRHSPVTGLTTVKGDAGAANMSRAPDATTSVASFFRI